MGSATESSSGGTAPAQPPACDDPFAGTRAATAARARRSSGGGAGGGAVAGIPATPSHLSSGGAGGISSAGAALSAGATLSRRAAPASLKSQIDKLSAVVAQKRGEVEKALSSNLELRVRSAALHLFMRCFEEMRAHRAAVGAPDDAAALGGMQQSDAQLLASVGLAGSGAGASAGGGGGYGGGGGGGGAGVSSAAADAAAAAALAGGGTDGVLDKLPHLAPGRSLLHLEG